MTKFNVIQFSFVSYRQHCRKCKESQIFRKIEVIPPFLDLIKSKSKRTKLNNNLFIKSKSSKKLGIKKLFDTGEYYLVFWKVSSYSVIKTHLTENKTLKKEEDSMMSIINQKINNLNFITNHHYHLDTLNKVRKLRKMHRLCVENWWMHCICLQQKQGIHGR